MKQLLITGGSGLIGRALVARLKRRYEITVLTRSPSRSRRLMGHQIHYITSLDNITDIDKFEGVINLAGEPIANKRWTLRQKRKICESRWHLTATLAEKIRASASPPAVFISASAVGMYGRQPADCVIDEMFTQYHDEFTHYLCARWEQLARQASPCSRVVLLRTGVVLAHHQGLLKKMEWPCYAGVGCVLGDGQQVLSWIHIEDVVEAILFLLHNHEYEGVFNITAPSPVSNRVFTQMLAKQMHRTQWLRMPGPVVQLLFGSMSDILLYGQYVIPAKLLEAGFEFRYPSLSRAFDDIYST